jgi:hypothetical protein
MLLQRFQNALRKNFGGPEHAIVASRQYEREC